MSLLDFLFPEQAQAAYLRDLAQSNRYQAEVVRANRYAEEKQRREAIRLNSKTDDRVKELEIELGQSALVIESLIGLLEEKGVINREDLKKRAQEIDAADGVIDGRITPSKGKPPIPARKWPGGQS